MTQKEELFNHLFSNNPLRLGSETVGAKSVRDMTLQSVMNSLFPSPAEDYLFLKSIWKEVEQPYSLWVVSQSSDGHYLQKLLREKITLKRFMQKAENKNFLRKIRRKVFLSSMKSIDSIRNKKLVEFYNSYSIEICSTNLELDSNSSSLVLGNYYNYYAALGYFVDRETIVNQKSIYYLAAQGKIDCNPMTFNIALFPWELEMSLLAQDNIYLTESSYLESYGWSKSQLISAIAENSRETVDTLSSLSKIELITYLRQIYGSDQYINIDLLRRSCYLSREALGVLARKSFNVSMDACASSSYEELLDRIEKIVTPSQVKRAQEVIDSLTCTHYGQTYFGLDCVFREIYEGANKSFWYSDFTDTMCLLVKFTPVNTELLDISYESFLKYSEVAGEVCIGYFVMVAQKIGLWPLVLSIGSEVTSHGLSELIESYLTELSPK